MQDTSNETGRPAEAGAAPGAKPKRTFRKVVRHFKIDRLLKPEDLKEYHQFLRQPATTIDTAVAWLAQRGYVVNPGTVHRHRHHYTKELEEVRQSARLAAALAELGRGEGQGGEGGGAGVFAQAAQTLFEQRLMQRLQAAAAREADDDPDAPAGAVGWGELAKAVSGAVAARRQLEAMRAEFERRSREAVKIVKDAEKDLPQYTGRPGWADTSKTAIIAERVRRILGGT